MPYTAAHLSRYSASAVSGITCLETHCRKPQRRWQLAAKTLAKTVRTEFGSSGALASMPPSISPEIRSINVCRLGLGYGMAIQKPPN
jgi:hypothetical protein